METEALGKTTIHTAHHKTTLLKTWLYLVNSLQNCTKFITPRQTTHIPGGEREWHRSAEGEPALQKLSLTKLPEKAAKHSSKFPTSGFLCNIHQSNACM